MKALLSTAVTVLLVCCFAATQTSTQSTTTTTTTTTKKSNPTKKAGTTGAATVEQLQAHEQMLLDAYREHKGDVFRKDLATNALMIDGAGPAEREKIISDISSGNCTVTTATITDAKVLNIDRDAAVLYYTLKVDGKCGSSPLPGSAYASTLYSRRAGKWVPVFHQETLPQGRGM